MKRELEEREKDKKDLEKCTYNYQLLGSSVDSKRRQGQTWSLHGQPFKPQGLHGPSSQVGLLVTQTLRSWVRAECSTAPGVPWLTDTVGLGCWFYAWGVEHFTALPKQGLTYPFHQTHIHPKMSWDINYFQCLTRMNILYSLDYIK